MVLDGGSMEYDSQSMGYAVRCAYHMGFFLVSQKRDPQLTMAFNTKSRSSATWMIRDTVLDWTLPDHQATVIEREFEEACFSL